MNEQRPSGELADHRVIGIRTDGTRIILCQKLTLPRAESVQVALAGIAAFREILIEVETDS